MAWACPWITKWAGQRSTIRMLEGTAVSAAEGRRWAANSSVAPKAIYPLPPSSYATRDSQLPSRRIFGRVAYPRSRASRSFLPTQLARSRHPKRTDWPFGGVGRLGGLTHRLSRRGKERGIVPGPKEHPLPEEAGPAFASLSRKTPGGPGD